MFALAVLSAGVLPLAADDLEGKLIRVTIPALDFEDASLEEGLGFFSQRANELSKEPGPVNFVVEDPSGTLKEKKVKWLRLKNVPAREGLAYLLTLCGARARFDAHAIMILPQSNGAPAEWRSETQRNVASVAARNREVTLSRITIPSLAFEEVSLKEGLEFFSQRASELSKGTAQLNFVVPDQESLLLKQAKALRLKNVPLTVALRYFLAQCGCEARYDANAIVIIPRSAAAADSRSEEQKQLAAAAAKNREAKFAAIKMPSINFEDTPLEEAIDFLHDMLADPEHCERANLIIEDPMNALVGKKIKSLKLKDVPTSEVLQYIVTQCGATVRYDEYALVISPRGAGPKAAPKEGAPE